MEKILISLGFKHTERGTYILEPLLNNDIPNNLIKCVNFDIYEKTGIEPYQPDEPIRIKSIEVTIEEERFISYLVDRSGEFSYSMLLSNFDDVYGKTLRESREKNIYNG